MAQVIPSKFLCLHHALCKRRAVIRNKVEDPIPLNPSLATIAAKRGGEKEKKKKGRRKND